MAEKENIDPRVAMLQIAVESLVESFKEQFEEYVRKIVVKVLDARDEALLEKLNKISEKHSQEDAKVLEERYNSLVTDTKSDSDGWVKWDGNVEDECDNPEGLDGQTVVEVKFRNGATGTGKAGEYYWPHDTVPHRVDILAYRIVE